MPRDGDEQPSSAAATAQGSSAQDSQYLTGFDSQFLDDPAVVYAAAAAAPVLVAAALQNRACQDQQRDLALTQPPASTQARQPAAARKAPASAPAHVVARHAPAAATAAAAVSPPVVSAGAAPALPPPAADTSLLSDAELSVIGRYIVKGRLGAGFLGPLYDAWDPVAARPVVVRTVRLQPVPETQALLDPTVEAGFGERFNQRVLDQARALVGLSHPHIAPVLDAAWSPLGVTVAMQRLTGRDMRQALARGWRPRPSLVAQIMRQVTEGLAHAHARGHVHGDVRPANIYLTEKGSPQLLDFGLAQAARSCGLDWPQTPVASLRYLAPEQLLGGPADVRTDIRAVGVVLYELLAMTTAFKGDTSTDVARAVLKNRPIPIRDLRRNISLTLSGIATRAMATDPKQRYSSAAQMARALAKWIDQHAARKARAAEAGSGRWPEGRSVLDSPVARRLVWVAGGTACCLAMAWQFAPMARAWLAPVAHPGVPGRAPDASTAPTPRALLPPGTVDYDWLAARQQREEAYAAKQVGILTLEVAPTAQVSVNGVATGTTPPMTQLKLPVGQQTITLRSEGFDPYSITVFVRHDQAVELRHRFTELPR